MSSVGTGSNGQRRHTRHSPPPRRLENCLNWRRSGGRRRSGSEEETPPPPIDPAPHGTNKRQKVKGLLIGGRERSCRGLGHARAGGRGEGGERFPRRMNAAQPGPRHCPDPGCSATPFPASSIAFPPSLGFGGTLIAFPNGLEFLPPGLPDKWNPGWGNPPAAAVGAGPELGALRPA